MTAQYDWSKLPYRWRHVKSERYGDEFVIGPCCTAFNVLDIKSGRFPSVLDILDACRIPEPSTPPDTANVTALRTVEGENGDIIVMKGGTVRTLHTQSADEYDWSKLEGSGWHYTPGCSHISNGRFAYHFDNGELMMPRRPGESSARTLEESREAYNTAYALVAKCKRDWRDEVKQACETVPVEDGWRFHAFEKGDFQPAGIVVHPMPGKMKLTCWDNKTMEVDGDADLAGCLALSTVIERLKKLGWREA